MLIRLSAHYYRPDFTEAQAKALIRDMVEDLEEFTIFDVEVAIRTYRRDPANRFFPRAADLRGLIEADRKERRITGGKVRGEPEFPDSRPAMWEYTRKRFWQRHWSADDLNTANDPTRRANFDKWLAAVKAGNVIGRSPDDY